MALLRSQIAKAGVADVPTEKIDGAMLDELFRLAKIHDVSEALFLALVECGVLGEGHEPEK